MPFSDAERRFLAAARVARLATADEHGRPHAVPICFALVEDRLVTPLDEKPKDADPKALRRVRNIEANPHVAVIADRYTEDWSELGWVQVRGTARLFAPIDADREPAVDALRAKYPQYDNHALDRRPLIHIDPGYVVSWGALERS
jgi:PPOX class probable F420-dependent enzyme